MPLFKSSQQNYFTQDITVLVANNVNATLPAANATDSGCLRVACKSKSAIYACNDNDFELTVALPTIANFAQTIMQNTTCSNSHDNTVLGQAFSFYGWNAIVGLRDD